MYIELSFLNSKVLLMNLYSFLCNRVKKDKERINEINDINEINEINEINDINDIHYDKYLIRDMIHFFFY